MNVAVCFNLVPQQLRKGEAGDRLSEEGSRDQAEAVADALAQLGHRPHLLPVGARIEDFVCDLRAAAPDVVFNLCEGFWGDSRGEMHVASVLELLGVPYTGAPPLCLGLSQDKARTKTLLLAEGLSTPPAFLVEPGESPPAEHALCWPLFVKPRFEDASLGISTESIVENEEALAKRISYIHTTYRQGALVEEFIDGREINAAVLGSTPYEPLPLSEIRFTPELSRPIVSYEGKWLEDSPDYVRTQPVCPAPLSPEETTLLAQAALRACRALGCRDYARVDIRLRGDIPYILEVNANPDISPDAGLARAAQAAGMSYVQLIERVLAMAAGRTEATHAPS